MSQAQGVAESVSDVVSKSYGRNYSLRLLD